MSATRGPASPGTAGGSYEKSDLRVKTIVIALVLVAALTVLGIVVSLGLFDLLSQRTARVSQPAFPTTAQAPETDLGREPPLQVNPVKDLARMRAEEEKILTTYGWADREAGKARIPVERAMALLLERGLPPAGSAASQGSAPAASQQQAQPAQPGPSKAQKAR